MGPVAVHGQGGRVDGIHRGHGVALDARGLNEPADGETLPDHPADLWRCHRIGIETTQLVSVRPLCRQVEPVGDKPGSRGLDPTACATVEAYTW